MASGVDPLLFQAEKIFAQRKSRSQTLPGDILGEPGWDILLLAFIAHRKATICTFDEVTEEIGLGQSAVERWIKILELRELVVVSHRGKFFSISEDAEMKLSAMFAGQIRELKQEIERASKLFR